MITQTKDTKEILNYIEKYFSNVQGKIISDKHGCKLLEYKDGGNKLTVVFNPFKKEKKKLSSAIIRIAD